MKLETNLDHLTGEELGIALDALIEMPAVLDAMYFPGIGKKNRPAGMLQILCRPEDGESVCKAIFRHTHTLGIRQQKMERLVLPRNETSVMLDGEEFTAKTYVLDGVEYARPEADAIRESARRRNLGAPGLRILKN